MPTVCEHVATNKQFTLQILKWSKFDGKNLKVKLTFLQCFDLEKDRNALDKRPELYLIPSVLKMSIYVKNSVFLIN